MGRLLEFFTLAQISPKRCQITIQFAQGSFGHLFLGDLSQNEKKSKIKPPLFLNKVATLMFCFFIQGAKQGLLMSGQQ